MPLAGKEGRKSTRRRTAKSTLTGRGAGEEYRQISFINYNTLFKL